ncbi:UBN2_3 domain-containing protein, partial [Cephalotus follicularis]
MATPATTSTTITYPYPTTLNVGNFVTIKLTHNNFLLWETQIISLIESHDLLGFLNGQTPAPEIELPSTNDQRVTNLDYTSWRKSSRLVKAWITGTLSEEVLGHVVGTETSQNLWTILNKAYTMSIANYLNRFKSIFDQLHLVGKPVSDQLKVFLLLTNLGPAYDAFTTMMLKPPMPSYAEVIPLLQSHELR